MPFVDGESLRERLVREGDLGVAAATRILCEVLDALSYAHGLGLVHRDIKPENIMLSGRHALLTDFGIAKALSGVSTGGAATATGVALGTPTYMAPEQIAPGADIDQRADIYAVGILGYELLAGRPPFRGTAHQVLAAHNTQPPSPLHLHRPGIPRALSDAIMRCLQKRPADRWPTAGEFLLHLHTAGPDRLGATEEGALPADVTERAFRLDDEVCRALDRASLDPRMIGDALTYLDNNVESDTLVVYLHGTGLDGRDFETVLRTSPYRGLAPTLYGCEPAQRRRASLPLAAHVAIVREFLKDATARLRPARTVVVGFSSGGDYAFQLAGPDIDGLLTLDCNLSLETCFVTRVLAGMSVDEPARLLAQLRSVGERPASVEEWVKVHDYLVKILRKFHGDVAPLRRFAQDVVGPFASGKGSPFVDWFRNASALVSTVRCVFSDNEANSAALARIKLDHLDRAVLGPRAHADSLVIDTATEHFELMNPVRMQAHIDDLLTALPQSTR